MSASLPAIRLRRWATVLLLIGLPLGLLLAVTSPAAGAESDVVESLNPLDQVVPDAIIQLSDSPTFDEDLDALAADVAELPGVAWAAGDQTADPRPRLMVGFEPGGEQVALRAIDDYVDEQPAGTAITVGGRAVVDRSIAEHLGRTVRLVVILATLAAGGLAAWLARPRHGGLVASVVLVAVGLSSALGRAAGGEFDGSLVTTPVPAVLAAIVVSVVLCFRLLAWFEEPQGDDQAEMIRRSVYHLGVELLLFFGGLVVATILLEFVSSARSMATVVLVGAFTSALVTLAIVPSVLAAMHGAGHPVVARERQGDGRRATLRAFLDSRPNGRHFPVAMLLAFGFFFGFLGLLSVGTETVPALLERSGTEAAVSGGDPTDAILAVFPPGTDQQAKTEWLIRVSDLPAVGRVDTALARYVGGERVELGGAPLGAFATGAEGDEAPGFALVVPTVTARSTAAANLVEEVRAANVTVDAELSGSMVEAATAGRRDRSVVWATIVLLALSAAAAIYLLVGDLALSALTATLRLLDSVAVVGLYQLLASSVSGPELLIVVFVAAIGASWFELGFVRRLLSDHRSGDTEELIGSSLGREGLAAILGLVVVAVASLGLIGGIGSLTRLGIVMIVAVVVEIVVGLWLLRPAVLGHAAVLHLASQPVRRALRRLNGASSSDDPEFSRWVVTVAELLQHEFRFQADPAAARVDTVFVADTPSFERAVERLQQLTSAGLRVIGRTPELRTLQVVAPGPPASVAATVDHPSCQLIDRTGKVVGLRKAERRTLMLWLESDPEGAYRIADVVELGSAPLEVVEAPVPAFAPTAQMSLE